MIKITEILCLIGIHDWEILDWEFFPEKHCSIFKRICLGCGKKDDEIARYREKREKKEMRKVARQKKAEELWWRNV